jgi:catechol 2,3-dioxygenase-like lactoylglutathione lyase family enzyme
MEAVIYVVDLERCVDFYAQVLGLVLREKSDGSCILDGQGLTLNMVQVPEAIAAEVELQDPPERREETPIKLVFEVADIASVRASAPAWGGSIDPVDAEWPWLGSVRCDGVDPEGNVLQVKAPPPSHPRGNMNAPDHRAVAIATYNRCWDLLEAERNPGQDLDLLGLALTSRHHWQQAGGPREWAIADWLASRCAAATGHPHLALAFANSSSQHDQATFEPWLKASLLEGQARAWASMGDDVRRDQFISLALDCLREEPDAENRALIEDQISALAT